MSSLITPFRPPSPTLCKLWFWHELVRPIYHLGLGKIIFARSREIQIARETQPLAFLLYPHPTSLRRHHHSPPIPIDRSCLRRCHHRHDEPMPPFSPLDDGDYDEIACEECRSGGREGECDHGYHIFCLKPIRLYVPNGSCSSCICQKMLKRMCRCRCWFLIGSCLVEIRCSLLYHPCLFQNSRLCRQRKCSNPPHSNPECSNRCGLCRIWSSLIFFFCFFFLLLAWMVSCYSRSE